METQNPDPKRIQKNLKIVSDLFEFAYRIKSHQLRLKHPEATDQEIKALTLAAIERGTR